MEKEFTQKLIENCEIITMERYLKNKWYTIDLEEFKLTETQWESCMSNAIESLSN